jgi:hypothetical protein
MLQTPGQGSPDEQGTAHKQPPFLQNKSSTVHGAGKTSLTLKVSLHPAIPGTPMVDATSFIKAVKNPSIPVNIVG